MKQIVVKMWGQMVGTVTLNTSHNYATFKYANDFLSKGIELSPLMMPLSNKEYRFSNLDYTTFYGLPGLLADSLPDRFGNTIFNAWFLSNGINYNHVSNVERLSYIANKGMGALEYEPCYEAKLDVSLTLDLKHLLKTIYDVLAAKGRQIIKPSLELQKLLEVGIIAGGMRPKAVLIYNKETDSFRLDQGKTTINEAYYLMKFDGIDFASHAFMTPSINSQLEYAYYLMAKKAGITISEARLYKIDNTYHFMTKRFDRITLSNGKAEKLHVQTLGALTHINYNDAHVFSYEEAVNVMRRLNLSVKEIKEFYRRMVFNVIARNLDDHVKNFSFLMDCFGVWSLAPAYDLTFSYDTENLALNTHQMSINKKFRNITKDDLLSAAKTMGIMKDDALRIINEVEAAVLAWPFLARSAFLSQKEAAVIFSHFNFVSLAD